MTKITKLLLLSLLVLLLTTCDNPKTDNSLPLSTPEAEGVSSAAVLAFVEAADKEANEIHSFMLLRHGNVIAEGWWKPYAPELKHTID
ncbi:MAG: hypothetical protein A2X05_03475 [Bacteroidetes bacterium GWE2_41_25]|nr:MAG: hypothetical protein A2X03_15945 [Bacteroidetes bacterium GWA2_40_15]OFX91837.1 MAG: hypothetical protein A2X05_03475 [Bacteroidetes bacterium GWE2_41_25]OFX94030.1 MAG: hypothetical protein A2X06_14855 [Bacteroidetes bacterium GWC2_40_22]